MSGQYVGHSDLQYFPFIKFENDFVDCDFENLTRVCIALCSKESIFFEIWVEQPIFFIAKAKWKCEIK